MSNPNPFVPKGSLLEQQSKRRSHLKIAVSCVLAVGIVGLVAMLIQGCKRNDSGDATADNGNNNPPAMTPPDTNSDNSTNSPAMNPPMGETPGGSNSATAMTPPPIAPVTPVPTPQVVAPTPTPVPVAPEASGSEYVVVSGDTLAKIAKKNGVSLKALEAANPDVNPKHLKVKQKLVIPAGGTSAGVAAPMVAADNSSVADTGASETTYTVKSGDTLHRIAKKFGTTVKAIEAENNLTTTKIQVGRKLKIPTKAEAAPAAPAPAAPMPEPPVSAPVTTAPPAPSTAPAPSAPGSPSGT